MATVKTSVFSRGNWLRCLIASAALLFAAGAANAATYRVTGFALASEGDGQSWASPMSLTNAVANAVDGDMILLAAGEYDVTEQTSFSKALTIKGGLAGTDDTTLAPSGKTTLNAFDRTGFRYIFSVSTAITDATNVFENICFTRAYRRGVAKVKRVRPECR